MEHNAAEDLPALYRAVLDRVSELEAAGDRAMARRLRTQAIRIYSRAWDARAQRRLQKLLRQSTTGVLVLESARAGARRLPTTAPAR